MSPKQTPKKPPKPKYAEKPLGLERRFTTEGVNPYDEIEWETRTARIGSPENPVFEQHGVEFPQSWSQNATNIVAQKYFAYGLEDERRERSVKQMIDRVVNKITGEGEVAGYFAKGEAEIFADELRHILVNQMASFNSPVWFNIGVDGAPQTSSACFILSVDDTLDSIGNWYTEEMKIFQAGSGAGVNLSRLRGSGESLSRGGASSGPVTFMRAADASAGTIQSGGVTRRAAKMVILDADHPDIEDFVTCKSREEERIRALARAGFDMSMGSTTGERNLAEATAYQNANQSVRVSDEFMKAVENDEEWELKGRRDGSVNRRVKARELLDLMADAAWRCADPGLQYETTIQDWHTTPAQGPITASNPCSEYLSNDNSACNLASLNLLKFLNADGSFDIEGFRHTARIIFLAQEITISFADFPTRKIAKNTRELRQIGIGYANLGALLMALGLPYDSDEGRDYAAAVTALLTGESYLMSTEIARTVGPFTHYEANAEPMQRVLGMHRDAAKRLRIQGNKARDIVRAARTSWEAVLENCAKHGIRNAQASVLAPTGCLLPSSLVLTDRGLARLDELGDLSGPKWQDVSFQVQTDEGPQEATKFFDNGLATVARLRTDCGYGLAGTPEHQVKVVAADGEWVWRRLADVREGDLLPLRLGGMIGNSREITLPPTPEPYFASNQEFTAPATCTAELAELVGYFMGDGSLHAKGLRFCVANSDPDLVEWLRERIGDLFALPVAATQRDGYIEVAVNSTALAEWWAAAGFAKRRPAPDHKAKGHQPHIPAAIRASNDLQIYAAFLRGLWEADGGASSTSIIWTSSSESFVEEVRVILLALGIASKARISVSSEDREHKGSRDIHSLRILNRLHAARFAELIGLLSQRKKQALEEVARVTDKAQAGNRDLVPVSRELLNRLEPENTQLRKLALQSLRRRNAVPRHLLEELWRRTEDAELGQLLAFFYDRVEAVELAEESTTYDLSVPSNVTYVANGLVSHNTISFMMDCDTTGIEPDFALVKHKTLVGGGTMTIVNRTVPLALKRLGYSDEQADEIVSYISEEVDKGGGSKGPRGEIVGAPHLRDEHLAVFDCALGQRAIKPMGHVRMMAAVQPFLSGAISKTVNLPESATAEEIGEVFIEGWKLGLKALAVYRDGSKNSQPLAEKSERDPEAEKAAEERLTSLLGDGLLRGERRSIPREAEVVGVNFTVGQVGGYVHVRLFEDGTPGAVFVDVGQAGSTLHGFIRAWAVTMSLGLQYGLPLDVLVSKLAWTQFEPAGFTDDPAIRTARSIVDYVIRWMGATFLDLDEMTRSQLGLRPLEPSGADSDEDEEESSAIPGGDIAPRSNVHAATKPVAERKAKLDMASPSGVCDNCGSANLQRTGSCFTCQDCGTTTGCG